MNDLPAQILELWQARVTAALGGRLNRHWQVEAGGEWAAVRRWFAAETEVRYELDVLKRVAALDWPVPVAIREPLWHAGAWWSLHAWLPGEAPSRTAARARGQLLAAFHRDVRSLAGLAARPGWRPAASVLSDPDTDRLLDAAEGTRPAAVRALRWHLHRARERVSGIDLGGRPLQLIHGDFTPWNLRERPGYPTGVLDFEFARLDDPLAEFALAWRGTHDDVLRGYQDHLSLNEEDWALLTPLWWSHLLEGACQNLRRGTWDDGWTERMLVRRSPLMGLDAAPFPG